MVGRVWAYPLYRGEFREVGGGMRLPRFGLWDAGSPREAAPGPPYHQSEGSRGTLILGGPWGLQGEV